MYDDFIRDSPSPVLVPSMFFRSKSVLPPLSEKVGSLDKVREMLQSLGIPKCEIRVVQPSPAFVAAAVALQEIFRAHEGDSTPYGTPPTLPSHLFAGKDTIHEVLQHSATLMSNLSLINMDLRLKVECCVSLISSILHWEQQSISTTGSNSSVMYNTTSQHLSSLRTALQQIIYEANTATEEETYTLIAYMLQILLRALQSFIWIVSKKHYPDIPLRAIWGLLMYTTPPGPIEGTSVSESINGILAHIGHILEMSTPQVGNGFWCTSAGSKEYAVMRTLECISDVPTPRTMLWGLPKTGISAHRLTHKWLSIIDQKATFYTQGCASAKEAHIQTVLHRGVLGYPKQSGNEEGGVLAFARAKPEGELAGAKGVYPATKGTLTVQALADRGMPKHCDLLTLGTGAHRIELPIFWGLAPGGLTALYTPADPKVRDFLVKAYDGSFPVVRVPEGSVSYCLTRFMTPRTLSSLLAMLDLFVWPDVQKCMITSAVTKVDIRGVLGAEVNTECSPQDTFLRTYVQTPQRRSTLSITDIYSYIQEEF